MKVHKTHDEWLVMSGDRTVCRCDFKEDAEKIAELESDRRRLEWLVINNARVWLLHGFYHIYDSGNVCIVQMVDDWRDAIDEAMGRESETMKIWGGE